MVYPLREFYLYTFTQEDTRRSGVRGLPGRMILMNHSVLREILRRGAPETV